MNAKKLKGLIKKNPEPARGRFGINPMDPWSAKYGIAEATDKKDQVILNIPLLIRVLELAREDIKTDMDLHRVVEKLIQIRNKGVLTMKDYNTIAHIRENHIARGAERGRRINRIAQIIDQLFLVTHGRLATLASTIYGQRLLQRSKYIRIIHDHAVMLAEEHAVRPRDGLHERVIAHRLVQIHR